MTPRELLGRASISDVRVALGGGPLRHGRGQAFWRNGDGFNISLDASKGVWFDHARGEGGGVLALIQAVLGCDRREALHWLAQHEGATLDDRPLTRDERRSFAQKRRQAELVAKDLTAWRARLLADLRAHRNSCWDAERRASAWAREHINDPAMAEDWRWEAVWAHALDAQRGEGLDRLVERIEAAIPAQLLALRRNLEARAA